GEVALRRERAVVLDAAVADVELPCQPLDDQEQALGALSGAQQIIAGVVRAAVTDPRPGPARLRRGPGRPSEQRRPMPDGARRSSLRMPRVPRHGRIVTTKRPAVLERRET